MKMLVSLNWNKSFRYSKLNKNLPTVYYNAHTAPIFRKNINLPFIIVLAFAIIGGTLCFLTVDGRELPAVGSETCFHNCFVKLKGY